MLHAAYRSLLPFQFALAILMFIISLRPIIFKFLRMDMAKNGFLKYVNVYPFSGTRKDT